jgi:hypothetical protein
MRYRLMATYRGVPYEAGVGPYGSDVVLFAACPPPEELGFEPATGHWRKRVIRAEVDALWESRPVGIFRDEPCIVLDDLGDRLHICYLGADPNRAKALGYWQVDRGVFELLTPRDEVSGLTEERVDKPLLSTQPPSVGGPESSYPYHPAPVSSPGSLLPPPPLPPAPSARAAPSARPASSAPPAPPVSFPPPPSFPPPASFAPPAPIAPPAPTDRPAPPAAPVAVAPPPRAPSALEEPFADTGGRAARRQRVSTKDIFSELADLAAIPRSAYALETEADGALCLVPTIDGFEVFVAMDGARHEARSFSDEEAAYFYMFGVLAAEAVRNGTLVPAVAPAGARHELS